MQLKIPTSHVIFYLQLRTRLPFLNLELSLCIRISASGLIKVKKTFKNNNFSMF